jgi:hypothetical protein
MKKIVAVMLMCMLSLAAEAQFRPPPFIGGIPGLAQSRAIFTQRQQSRTKLYREALDELRQNPKAADLPSCSPGISGPCLAISAPTTATAGTVSASVAPPVPEVSSADRLAPEAKPEKGRRIALLIGNNDYRMPIPPLETPIADVSSIASLLEARFGYETRVVKDASQNDMILAINRIAKETKADDSVLLFYAGHGYMLDDIGMGFWIPVGASIKTAKGWISNEDINKLLTEIKARQLILISDSCYSGTLTKEDKVTLESNSAPAEILQRRSVVVLSSGGDEPVTDEGKDGHSIFAYNLIKTLEGTGNITAGARIWKTVHRDVTKAYPQQPQYGAVVSAGHVTGGDYLFQTK